MPTTLYEQDKVSREIDGVQLEMVRLPGESEEEIMIWLPQKKVLCCGDNFYGCFPNLYAIRGGQYRDLAAWIHSIDVLMSYPAEYLLPGHTAAILGHETISSTLGNFRNAFEYILTQTLEGMNAGKTADQLAADIQLPPNMQVFPIWQSIMAVWNGRYGPFTRLTWDGSTGTPRICTPCPLKNIHKR